MYSQTMSSTSKLAHIIDNLQLIPDLYRGDILSMQSLLTNPTSTLEHSPLSIKIQTFYLLTQPALSSLHWEDPHEENKYPVAIVICNKIEQTQEYGVSLKFVTWIQSGGVRCIGLKMDASDLEIQKLVKLSHCAVVSDLGSGQHVKNFIHRFIDIAQKQAHYPIIFTGNSGFYAFSFINNSPVDIERKQESGLSEIYIDHESKLFKGLQLPLRLLFENRKKHAYPLCKFIFTELSKGLEISSTMQIKNQSVACTIEHHKDLYWILCDPCISQVPENIQLWHYAIMNFVNMCKKQKKQIDQKKVDKNLIAHHKIVYRSEKGYYRLQ